MDLFNIFCDSASYDMRYPDQFGRSRFYNSGNQHIFNPIVSREIRRMGFSPFYPGGKAFAVAISHDIDKVYEWKSGTAVVSSSLRHLIAARPKALANEVLNALKLQPYHPYSLGKLLDIHQRYKIRSTYFCQAFTEDTADFNYRLKDISGIVSRILKEGNEIGLHSSPAAIADKQRLRDEKERLESFLSASIRGNRTHFLSFSLPGSWHNLRQVGFEYDATFGYPDTIGFRNGMCYPHYPFDLRSREFLEIVELPLVVMDTSVFVYMRLDRKVFQNMIRDVISAVKECGGVLTVLWHNHYLEEKYLEYYESLLQIIQESDPWIATHNEVMQWWKGQGLLEMSHNYTKQLFKPILESENNNVVSR